jgi:hypothetical protein
LSQLEAAARLARAALLRVRGQVDQHEAACHDLREYFATLRDQAAARPVALEDMRRRTGAWDQLRAQAEAHATSRRRLIETSVQLAQSEKRLAELQAAVNRIAGEAS